MRLIDRLKAQLGISGKKAKDLLDRRLVFVNDRRVWIASYQVSASDRVTVESAPALPRTVPTILHRDPHLLAVDKPPGLLSVGPDSAESLLRPGHPGLTAVHRLDKDTSGVLLFGLSATGTAGLLRLFKGRRIAKTYLGIVAGHPPAGLRRIDAPLDGLAALTELSVLASSGIATLLEIRIRSGRTHQIRRHLALAGLRLLGERTYRQSIPERKSLFRSVPRQMLHAWTVSFPHPATAAPTVISAPLPPDFQDLCGRLGLPPPPRTGGAGQNKCAWQELNLRPQD